MSSSDHATTTLSMFFLCKKFGIAIFIMLTRVIVYLKVTVHDRYSHTCMTCMVISKKNRIYTVWIQLIKHLKQHLFMFNHSYRKYTCFELICCFSPVPLDVMLVWMNGVLEMKTSKIIEIKPKNALFIWIFFSFFQCTDLDANTVLSWWNNTVYWWLSILF